MNVMKTFELFGMRANTTGQILFKYYSLLTYVYAVGPIFTRI